MELLDFTFNFYGLLSYLAVIANIIVVYLIFSKGLEISANRWFVLTVIILIPWCISDTLSRFSANPQAASFWESIGIIGWVFVSPLFLSFTLAYIGREKALSRFSRLLPLFGPAFVFLYLGWSTDLIYALDPSFYHKTRFGWATETAPLFWLIILWITANFVAAILLLANYYFKLKDHKKKNQTALMLFGVLVPVVGGLVTNGFLPIFGLETFQAAVPLTTVMSITITYAIFKYNLFVINPAVVATNIVETMNEILVVLNPDHFIEFVNNATASILGYQKEELIGQHMRKLAGKNWQDFQTKVLQELDAGRPVSGVEVNLESAKGKEIPVNFSASLFKDNAGRVIGEVGLAIDIREIRSLLTNITAERNKLGIVMSSIVDGVIALDLKGKITLANPASLTMLGLAAEDVLGKKIDEVLTMFDGDQRIIGENLLPAKELVADTTIIQKKNLKVITNFGKQIFVDLTSSSIKEGPQVGLGAIITMNDVSKERELEEMKLDFVSMAAHELRTPLTAIRGYLSVLQEEVSGSLSKEQKSFLDKAFVSSSQLASLVENLLSVSRIERGAMRLDITPADWGQILTEAVSNFTPLASEKGVNLSLKYEEALPKVLVDKFRIGEVLANLIGNAIAYTKPGGSIKVTAEKSDGYVVTHVKDTGQGIPETALPRLFTKFFRVSGILEQGSKGTGLGLYISKAIVDLHKGKIWVESKLGVGSTFSFTVPAVNVAQEVDKEAAEELVLVGQEKVNKEDHSSGASASLPEVQSQARLHKKAKRFFKRK